MLEHLLHLAITAAHDTDGAVDPTVGSSLIALGNDRDIRELPTDAGPVTVARAPGWRAVGLRDRRLRLPMGVVLDLGATAKAAAADLVARQVHERLGTGVLVSLGGDIATAGPGPGGSWQVLVQDDADQPACRVGLPAGAAVATSSTARRTWQRDGRSLHHIVDPYTGLPATLIWRTVSIAAPTCAEANAASTAALVHGAKATRWLRERAFTARLVGHDGRVVLLGGWPDEHRRPAA
jgi:thiamine biosynthesis lipoprotein